MARLLQILTATILAVSLTACRTKQHAVSVSKQQLLLEQQNWLANLQLDETVTLFDLTVSDSDTIATPRRRLQRVAHIQQEDVKKRVLVAKDSAQSVEQKSTSSRDDSHQSFYKVIAIVLVFSLLLLISKLLLRLWE